MFGLIFVTAVLVAQDAPEGRPQDFTPPPGVVDGIDVRVETRESQRAMRESNVRTHPFDRAENIERVIDQAGVLTPPWEEVRNCVADRCAIVIRHSVSGEIGQLEGEWQGGFMATGRGREVIRIRAARRTRGEVESGQVETLRQGQ